MQQIKDLALSLQWFGLLLWHGFDPWSGNVHMPQAWPERKKSSSDFIPFPHRSFYLQGRKKGIWLKSSDSIVIVMLPFPLD